MIRKLLISIFIANLSLLVYANGFSVGNYYYQIIGDGTKVSVSKNGSLSGDRDITIPSEVTDGYNNYYTVTEINSYGFSGCSNITSVTLPSTLTSIGLEAFSGCTSLTSISIPENVTSIGSEAFYECTSLKTVTFQEPSLLKTISDHAFFYCSKLTSITIPNSVETIGDNAFCGCSALTNAALPTGLKTISNYLFQDCSNLTSITIPSTVTAIGESAFNYCSSLTSITLPSSVKQIDESAFGNCTNLSTISVGCQDPFLGSYVFTDTKWYDNLPNGEIYINNAYYHYKGYYNPTSITIKDGTTSISGGAFNNFGELKSVTIPNTVVYIGKNAFPLVFRDL